MSHEVENSFLACVTAPCYLGCFCIYGKALQTLEKIEGKDPDAGPEFCYCLKLPNQFRAKELSDR